MYSPCAQRRRCSSHTNEPKQHTRVSHACQGIHTTAGRRTREAVGRSSITHATRGSSNPCARTHARRACDDGRLPTRRERARAPTHAPQSAHSQRRGLACGRSKNPRRSSPARAPALCRRCVRRAHPRPGAPVRAHPTDCMPPPRAHIERGGDVQRVLHCDRKRNAPTAGAAQFPLPHDLGDHLSCA